MMRRAQITLLGMGLALWSCESLLGADFEDLREKGNFASDAQLEGSDSDTGDRLADAGDGSADARDGADLDRDGMDRSLEAESLIDSSDGGGDRDSDHTNWQVVFWFDAARGIELYEQRGADGSVLVKYWRDQSDFKNLALQENVAHAPIFLESAINGLPALSFRGPVTFLQIPNSASLNWGFSDFALLAVIRRSTRPEETGQIYHKTAVNEPWTGPQLALRSSWDAVPFVQVQGYVTVDLAQPSKPIAHAAFGLVSMRRLGWELELRINGTLAGHLSDERNAVSVDNSMPASIGQNLGAPNKEPYFQCLGGEIAELVGIVGTMEASELRALEGALLEKYGLIADTR
jgi:hypothetical protein